MYNVWTGTLWGVHDIKGTCYCGYVKDVVYGKGVVHSNYSGCCFYFPMATETMSYR